MEKKQGQILMPILIIVGIILLLVVFYFLFGRDIIQKANNNNEPSTTENDKEQKTIELSSIDMNKELPKKYNEPEMLPTINGDKEFKINSNIIKVSYDGNKLAITMDNTDSYSIENVQKVFYDNNQNDCWSILILYAFSDNKIYVWETSSEPKFIEIENKNNYDSIYFTYLYALTCGAKFERLGHTSSGKLYNLETGIEYIKDNYYYFASEDEYIKTNRDFKLLNITGKAKVMMFGLGNDNIIGIIDGNNQIYIYDTDEKKYNLVNPNSVKTIIGLDDIDDTEFYDNTYIFGEIALEFVNGTKEELGSYYVKYE